MTLEKKSYFWVSVKTTLCWQRGRKKSVKRGCTTNSSSCKRFKPGTTCKDCRKSGNGGPRRGGCPALSQRLRHPSPAELRLTKGLSTGSVACESTCVTAGNPLDVICHPAELLPWEGVSQRSQVGAVSQHKSQRTTTQLRRFFTKPRRAEPLCAALSNPFGRRARFVLVLR